MRPSSIVLSTVLLLMVTISGPPAAAEANGPDYWRVAGVRANDVLNLRSEPNARARIIAGMPHDASGLRNLGCRGGPTFAEWQRMTPAQRQASARARWCRVEYQGRTGWVAGRFLAEGPGPAR